MAVFEADRSAQNPHLLDLRFGFKRVSVGENEVGKFALVDGAEAADDALNVGGVQRQSL